MSKETTSKKLLSPNKFQPLIFQTFFAGCMQIVFNMTGVFSLGVNIGPAT
jgi:hypothetical protein